MTNDLRDRVARAIADVREGGWPADTYAMLQQHYLTMADAAIAAMEAENQELRLQCLAHEVQAQEAYAAQQRAELAKAEEALTEYDRVESAKAAAQADYDRRIRAALKGGDE